MLPNSPFSADSLLRLLLRLCITLLAVGLMGAAAEKLFENIPEDTRRFWINSGVGVGMQLGALFWIAVFVSENRLTWGQAFGFRRRGAGRSILLGVLAAAVVFSMTLFLLLPASQWLMELVHLTPQPQDAIEALRKTHDLARQSAVAVSAVVLAPVFEELLFRGVFFAALKQAGLPRLAFWLSAIIWAATHVNLMTFLPLVFFGAVLNLLYERTGNLLAPITAHALFNLVNYLWVVLGPAVE